VPERCRHWACLESSNCPSNTSIDTDQLRHPGAPTDQMSSRTKALSLYRGILRAHRKLEPELKRLGDAYVRDEFQRHKAAKPKFLANFFREWEKYLHTLEAQNPALGQTIGADLTPDAVAAMSDEQKAQLSKLRNRTVAAFDGESAPTGTASGNQLQ
jgi:Complex1_LYR-like